MKSLSKRRDSKFLEYFECSNWYPTNIFSSKGETQTFLVSYSGSSGGSSSQSSSSSGSNRGAQGSKMLFFPSFSF